MNFKLTLDLIRKFPFYSELILLASFLFCILNLNLMAFDSTMSLHLFRSFEWLNRTPSSWLGPTTADLSLRLTPVYYWIVAAFWSITQSIEGLIFIHILLSYLCFYLLQRELKKILSLSGVNLWAFLFLFTPALFISIRRLENASFLNASSALIFFAALNYQKEQSSKWLWVTTVIALITSQIHLGILIPFCSFLIMAFVKSEIFKTSKINFFCILWFFAGLTAIPFLEEFTYLILPVAYLLSDLFERFMHPRILKYSFLSVCILLTLGSFFHTVRTYWDQTQMGRTFSLNGISSQMNLKMKKFIYSLQSANGTDPFAHLHGRAINRMRRDEMNFSQTQPYFSLYQSLSNHKVHYDRTLIEKRPESSWLFQLRNKQEMQIGAESPFLMTEIKPHSLPQNAVIKYLNERSQGIEKMHWNNTNIIMPLAFLNHPKKTKIVRLEFDIDSQTDKYLNLLLDADKTYKLLQVKINKKVQAIYEHYIGSPSQQSQYIYKIADRTQHAKVVVEFKVLTEDLPNYSRLDIFTSGYLLASEF